MTSIFDILPANDNDAETLWFKGGEKPGQPGVYKRIYYTGEGWSKPSFCLWDGERWYGGANDLERAMDEPRTASYYQPWMRDGFDFAWCGLMPADMPAEDPQFDLALEPAAEEPADSFFEE